MIVQKIQELLSSAAELYASLPSHVSALLDACCNFASPLPSNMPEKPTPRYFAKLFYTHCLSIGMDLRIKENGLFMLYHDGFWAEVSEIVVKKAIYLYAVSAAPEPCQTSNFINSVYSELSVQRDIFHEKNYNGEFVLLNMRSNVVKIDVNGDIKILPHDKEYGFTYKLTYDYDPNAKCPLFWKYFDKVLPEKSLQKICLQYLGYCLIPQLNLEKSLILLGSGSNGKSVFFRITKALLGEQNVTSFSLRSLTDDKGYTRAKIEGKLVNYGTEISFKTTNTELLKTLISREPVEARLPYRDPYIITNYAKLIFNANELPTTDDTTYGYFRRFLIVPFKRRIKEDERDPQLAQKIIQKELAGVFNEVLAQIPGLLKNMHFEKSKEMEKEILNYEIDNNNVFFFLKNKPVKKDENNTILCVDLYSTYKAFCVEFGFKPFSYRAFLKHLSKKIKVKKTREGKVAYARIPL